MFLDRYDAGGRLAARLKGYEGRKDAVVLAVPRGGVVVASVVALELRLELDVILTKKIGHPYNPEYAVGSVSLTGEEIDQEVVDFEGILPSYLSREIERLRQALRERYDLYRGGRQPVPLAGRTAIIVDDGAATGLTLMEAVSAARRDGAAKVVVAIPVGSTTAVERLRSRADEVTCLETPDYFFAIGQFYEEFEAVEDEEAIRLLERGRTPQEAL